MSSEPAAIRVRDLGKCFPVYARPTDRLRQFLMPPLYRAVRREPPRFHDEYWALRGVSFDVHAGEQLGIVGRNGAGKSTLLQLICGTLTPTTGSVDVAGRVAALLELGAGFNPELTGTENIFLNGSVLGLERQEIEARYDSILAFADIPGFIDQPLKSYSSGMYMRLAFAVAVHVEPDVLVVDEALAVGDEAYQRKCHARIRRLREAGTTILFVSHSAGHVTEVCDRALLLDRGEMLCIGGAKEVVGSYQKLLYALPGSEDDVRRHIATHAADARSPDPAATLLKAPVDQASWEEGLVPQSTVAYPSNGCTIHDVRLETPDGRRVNVLRPGDDYIYIYRAEFQAPAVAVRFGMMVRSLTGVELAGAASHPEHLPIPHVPSGSRVEVRFRFCNRLTPGTYFLNAGVVGMDGEVETYLARHLDVSMFRVARDPMQLATGFLSLDVEPQLEFC